MQEHLKSKSQGFNCSIENHQRKLELICLDKYCAQKRLACVQCVNQLHKKHDLISVGKFQEIMEEKLQINNVNIQKKAILVQLKKQRDYLFHRIELTRSKLMEVLGKCEDRIESYFSKVYKSFAINKHEFELNHFRTHFNSQTINEYLNTFASFQNLHFGTLGQTKTMIQTSHELFVTKMNAGTAAAVQQFEKIYQSLNQLNFACLSSKFDGTFSQLKKSPFLSISDSQCTVTRVNGVGGYPMCLLNSPFDPVNNQIKFLIQKQNSQGKKSIWLGACLLNIVKNQNYQNSAGMGKGTYAIDQANPYYMGADSQLLSTSWNHHDSTFNQTSVGSTELVGWDFGQGDQITVYIDYYNSNVVFMKLIHSNSEDQEPDQQVYEMPVKLDQGPLYPFVGCSNKGDVITIIPNQQ